MGRSPVPAPRARVGALVPAAAGGVASGVLLWLASPPVGVGWLAWVAVAPAAAVALGASAPRARRLAVPLAYAVYLELLLVPALPLGIAAGQWGDTPIPIMIGDSPVVAVALVAVPALAALLYLVRFGQTLAADPVPGALRDAAVVALPAASWTALDLVRVKLDPGGLIGPLFASQADTGAGRLAALGGPWLVTFAIVAAGYAVALACVRLRTAAVRRARPLRLTAALAPPTVAAAAVAALAALSPVTPGTPALTVAAVQPGYDTAEDGRPVLRHFGPGGYAHAALDLIGDLSGPTGRAARRGAEVVVWPEAVAWVEPTGDARVRRALLGLARRSRSTLVVPYFMPADARGAALIVTPGGPREPQPKQRAMWFLGERGWEGPGAVPVDGGSARIGALLGMDSQDTGVARELAERGASLLTSSTHDWERLAPHQRAMGRITALATGRPLVRADWRHGSAIYGRDGAALAEPGSDKRRLTVVADVPAARETPYVALGDAGGWAAAAAAGGALLAVALRGRRRRRSPRGAGR